MPIENETALTNPMLAQKSWPDYDKLYGQTKGTLNTDLWPGNICLLYVDLTWHSIKNFFATMFFCKLSSLPLLDPALPAHVLHGPVPLLRAQ